MLNTMNPIVKKCTPILLLIALCLATSLVPAGDTPQAVFEAAQEAGAKKDFNALSKLVAPSEQPMLAFGTDMAVGMFVEFYEGEKSEELMNKYQEIQNKYKVKTEEEDESEKLHITSETPQEVIDAHMIKRAKKLYGHVDVPNYVPDLMALVIDMPELAEQEFFPQEELTDFSIDGDRATGNAGEREIRFIREEGCWYLTADVME